MRAKLRTAPADALADDAVRAVVLDHTAGSSARGWTSARRGTAAFREKRPVRWVPAAY